MHNFHMYFLTYDFVYEYMLKLINIGRLNDADTAGSA